MYHVPTYDRFKITFNFVPVEHLSITQLNSSYEAALHIIWSVKSLSAFFFFFLFFNKQNKTPMVYSRLSMTQPFISHVKDSLHFSKHENKGLTVACKANPMLRARVHSFQWRMQCKMNGFNTISFLTRNMYVYITDTHNIYNYILCVTKISKNIKFWTYNFKSQLVKC